MSRWDRVAAHLATVGAVGAGTAVSVFATSRSVLDAVDAFVAEVYRRDGTPQVLLADERYDRYALDHASTATLSTPAPLELHAMAWSDFHVSFRGMTPPPARAPDALRLSLQRGAKGIVSTARWEQTRWALVRVPTPEWADLIGVPAERLNEEFFAGALLDWSAHGAHLERLCRALNSVREVRIEDADTNLRLGCAGRTWIPFAGALNLPDGEVATAPLEDRVQGEITFPGRFWFGGAEIADLRLEFHRGAVVKIAASTGAEIVERLLSADGARRVGELGIGTNPHVQTLTGDLLIDEKILGTVHIALGRSYPECGGLNRSAIHWDIVKDLRRGGRLTVDRRVLIDGPAIHPMLSGEEEP